MSDLVMLRFAVPVKMTTTTATEVFIRTCGDGVIRISRTALSAMTEKSSHVLLEARVPRDVAAAFRSLYGELFRLTRAARTRS